MTSKIEPSLHVAKGISVIVPVFNSESTLEELHKQLVAALTPMSGEYEIILIDDGSHDQSWKIINDFCKSNAQTIGIQLTKNFGQHNALLCGIREAKYSTIVTLDDDLQNPPSEIPTLLQELSLGHDVVYGIPKKEQHGFLRDLASHLTKFVLQKAMGAKTAQNVSAFRAFRCSLREAFKNYQSSFISIDVLLTWGTSRFSAVKVDHHSRKIGNSNYTLKKLFMHAINMLTGFSTFPLQLASIIGFVFTFFGLGVLIYIIIRFILEGSVVPGFPFLASIISIFAGAQLFALGIIGEYLARMHFRSMEKPTYLIRNTSSSKQ